MKVNIKQVRSTQEEHADIYAAEVTEQIQYARELLENNRGTILCMDDAEAEIVWQWYVPLSIIFTSFLCAVPTFLILDWDGLDRKQLGIRLALHFLSICALVSLCGYFFRWYTDWPEYIPIGVMIVLIYFFVWAATRWITKSDARKINEALKDIQDKE